jgi:hypothetical protein
MDCFDPRFFGVAALLGACGRDPPLVSRESDIEVDQSEEGCEEHKTVPKMHRVSRDLNANQQIASIKSGGLGLVRSLLSLRLPIASQLYSTNMLSKDIKP